MTRAVQQPRTTHGQLHKTWNQKVQEQKDNRYKMDPAIAFMHTAPCKTQVLKKEHVEKHLDKSVTFWESSLVR